MSSLVLCRISTRARIRLFTTCLCQSPLSLLRNLLCITFAHEKHVGTSLPKGVFHLEQCPISDPNPQELVFHLQVGSQQYQLRAASKDDKTKWKQIFLAHDLCLQTQAQQAHRSHFCSDCNGYVDLDAFTLCEKDGAITWKTDKKELKRVWAVLSEKHLALFASREHITRYEPLVALHVTAIKSCNSSAVESDRSCSRNEFAVKSGNKWYLFDCGDINLCNEWVEALTALIK